MAGWPILNVAASAVFQSVLHLAGNSDATAASLANAFASGGSEASAYAAAVAQAISQNGCSPYQATLASAH